MASSYALPASTITNTHHGHTHLHSHSPSHSHSPARQYQPSSSPRNMRADRPSSLIHSHSHSHSESNLDHYSSSPQRNHSHSYAQNHHRHESEYSASSPRYLPTPPGSSGLPPSAFQKRSFEPPPPVSQLGHFEPPLNPATHAHDHDHHHDHHHDHDHHDHKHDHSHLHPHTPAAEPKRSTFTNMLLPLMIKWPIMHTIMIDKDSRRIFYFMSLNFAFMIVQACYGVMTDSLGLLSDSIHMFFDCLALGVGLFAAIASKWPPSERFPYGFGKIECLSGFGNGVFLMLISIEIMIEATERLAEGRETKRLAELFVVSAMGLAVNLIGMACFGHHGHHGHDHGHSHGGHDHGHSHSHSHSDQKKDHSHGDCSHDLDHKHDDHLNSQAHDHDHAHTASLLGNSPAKVNSHAGHSHSHDNENMHGIFLHVLADTMGSAAVMVSTALIYFTNWAGWDPLASCIIAILIFLSSIPLIKSSARKLLLTVPDEIEYSLREVLSGVSDIRGVGTYSVPKFWMADKETGSEGEQVLGVIHVSATRGSDLDDVADRTRKFLLERGIDVVVQVEAAGDASCWCSGSGSRSPSMY